MPQDDRAYRVLARKYRPADFTGLIGQEAMVRTLKNAIAQGRLAHAYMLTGVRGVGKTTTARILARAFNCQEGPTITPCGQCDHCRAIAEDSHVDVIEMDAASRTGVNDIRELIEGVRYRPVSARFKIYIIDEVHMLSVNAFNALLKTLEEPPEHVKFIFATTEIRKVPVTVLSRCQRFDLRRIDEDILIRHFEAIAKKEGADIDLAALALIARAADGSARDGLSLLDQAIAAAENGKVDGEKIRDMLGLADRTQIFDLMEYLFDGNAKAALDLLGYLHHAGADPLTILQDLLDLTHWLTRIKVTPEILQQPLLPEVERERGKNIADRLNLPLLGRAWQVLLKGLGEVQLAPDPAAALEMVLIRFMHFSHQPTPGELVRKLRESGQSAHEGPGPAQASVLSRKNETVDIAPGRARAVFSRTQAIASQPEMENEENSQTKVRLTSFADLVALAQAKKEGILHTHLTNVHPVHFEPGRIEFRPVESTPPQLATRLSAALLEWTGERWLVTLSSQAGQSSIKEQHRALEAARLAKAAQHPLVLEALKSWPQAKIEKIIDLPPPAGDFLNEMDSE